MPVTKHAVQRWSPCFLWESFLVQSMLVKKLAEQRSSLCFDESYPLLRFFAEKDGRPAKMAVSGTAVTQAVAAVPTSEIRGAKHPC
mmetsp:Transcript_64108/g.126824  ORF Transcript_64108/g.126824 Transcript_64108/m.126824 type:complete len:86 (+) Transcript_64108:229-486(+)